MERYSAVVTKVVQYGDDIATLHFTLDDGTVFDYDAGQYITVYFEGSSTPAGKAYSLSSAPHEAQMSITVKKIGEFSGKLHALTVGQTFLISQPYGYFNPKTDRPLVALCAGCGVSPVLSIFKDELARDPARTARLFYSNKSHRDIAHRQELDRLEAHDSVRVHHHITREDTPPSGMAIGRIIIDDVVEAAEDARYLVCGSVEFVRDMWRGLTERGVPAEAVSTETFFEQ